MSNSGVINLLHRAAFHGVADLIVLII